MTLMSEEGSIAGGQAMVDVAGCPLLPFALAGWQDVQKAVEFSEPLGADQLPQSRTAPRGPGSLGNPANIACNPEKRIQNRYFSF